MIVAVQIGPDGGIRVEILTPARISQNRSAPGHDYNRLAREPIFHLGERVPNELMIEPGQFMHAEGLAQRWNRAERNQLSFPRRRATSSCTSSAVCAAVTVTRNRAFARATVG